MSVCLLPDGTASSPREAVGPNMSKADGRSVVTVQSCGGYYQIFYPTSKQNFLKALVMDAVWRVCLTTVSIGYDMRT